MKNSISSSNEQQLLTWYQIISDCKEAKASGIKISDWLNSQGISRDSYYYWYSQVKDAYLNDSLPEIVPVKNELFTASVSSSASPSTFDVPVSSDIPHSAIMLSINDISIDVSELSNLELLSNIIKVVRYA